MTLGHRCLVSPEWAPGASDPPSLVLLLPPVEPLALPVAESEWKLLRLREQLGSELARELVPVSTPAPAPVPGVSRMARPPLSARHTEGVCVAPQGTSSSSHCSR